jgi:fibronectin-binding autotransporter adhesin
MTEEPTPRNTFREICLPCRLLRRSRTVRRHRLASASLRWVVAGSALLFVASESLAQVVWNGSQSTSWSDGANWSGGSAPSSGDAVVFPAGAANLVNTNDLPAGTAISGITFAVPGYFIQGNSIALGSGGIVTGSANSGTALLNLPLQLSASQTWTAAMGLTVLGSVDLNGQTLTLTANAGSAGVVDGIISGNGALLESGEGTWLLGGANTFAGSVQIEGGYLIAANSSALGIGASVENGTTVANGATLELAAPSSGEYLAVTGSGMNNLGALRGGLTALTGTVNLTGSGATIFTTATMTFLGTVTGPGALTLSGGGTFVLAAPANFSGGLHWTTTETLVTGVPNALNPALAPDLTTNMATGVGGTLSLSGQPLTLSGLGDSIGGFGTVDLGASPGSTLTITGETTVTFSGTLSGYGSLSVTGGFWGMVGGSLLLNGSVSNTGGNVGLDPAVSSIATSYTQSGSASQISLLGTWGDVTINDGLFNTTEGDVGTSTAVTQSFTLGPAATFLVYVGPVGKNSPTVPLQVNGMVALGNATLEVFPLLQCPTIGQTFTLIENDGSDPVSGNFSGLPGGTTFSIPQCDGISLTITYSGGSGNDVVLTVVAPPATAPLVASGRRPYLPDADFERAWRRPRPRDADPGGSARDSGGV